VAFKNDPQDNLRPSRGVLAADDLRFDSPELLVGDVSFLLRAREEECR